MVEPETLRFCYRSATAGTLLDGSILEIDEVAATARCEPCAHEFPVAEQWFVCPRCDQPGARVVEGNELELTAIELLTQSADAQVSSL